MKTKNSSKKLTLNKKTVAHLNKNELKSINGGAGDTTAPTIAVTKQPSICCESMVTAPC